MHQTPTNLVQPFKMQFEQFKLDARLWNIYPICFMHVLKTTDLFLLQLVKIFLVDGSLINVIQLTDFYLLLFSPASWPPTGYSQTIMLLKLGSVISWKVILNVYEKYFKTEDYLASHGTTIYNQCHLCGKMFKNNNILMKHFMLSHWMPKSRR